METDVRLERAWRAESTDEPSAGLDAAIRAAARRAVKAGPRPAHSPFSARWRVPLSLAAVVVVSATVTFFVAERRDHLPGETASSSASGAKPAQPLPPSADAVSSAMPDAPAEPRANPQADSAGANPQHTPAPGYRSGEDASAKADAAAREANSLAKRRGDPAGDKDALLERPASAPPAARQQGPAAAPEARSDQAAEPAAGSPADAHVGQARISAPQTAQMDERLAPEENIDAVPDAAEGAATRRVSPASPRVRAESAAPPSTDGAPERRLLRADTTKDAQAWIQEIRELTRAGKRSEARRALEEFRRRYPGHAVPDDLVSLLPRARD
jgi:hypothetical protein